ncbi:MAG: PQQ-binding-like beta-propeller repeat protein [Spirochaetes bacterium]|nr:PQQ-binding-like beta-propeller repeat protein [Spirochaetota bacterium]
MRLPAALLLIASLFAGNWPQHAGPERRGVSPETGLLESFGDSGPAELWRVDVGAGFAGVAVYDGRVYLLDRPNNDEDALRCFRAEDGREEWKAAYPASGEKVSYPGSRGSPTVDGEFAFAMGVYGHFSAFHLKGRKLAWQKDLMGEFAMKLPTWGFSQCPLLYRDSVIIAVQSDRVGVGAYEKKTGRPVWESRPLKGGVGYVSPTLAKIDGTEMVVAVSAGGGGEVVAFSAEKGEELWTFGGWKCGIPITAPLPLPDGKIFITGGYRAGSALIQVRRAGSGFEVKLLWKADYETAGAQIHIPILLGDFLYLFSNSNEKKDGLICLSLAGEKKWGTGSNPVFGLGGGVAAGGRLWAIDDERRDLVLVELSPESYREISSAKIMDTKMAWCPPALADGRLYLRDQNSLRCLDVAKK